jgi:transposase
VCDGEGAPLNIELSPGQTHETQLFEELWNATEVFDQKLNYQVQPEALAGDKAYRSSAIIERLESEQVQAVIPQKGAKAHDQDHPGFDREAYRRRNVVERLIGWLKESRRVFSRFEKTAVNYLGMIQMACIRYYLARLV